MARDNRIRRNVLLDFSTSEISRVIDELGASDTQIRKSWSRAIKRTSVTLRRLAMSEVKTAIAPRKPSLLKRRCLPPFITKGGVGLDEIKIWFGLNQVKIRDLKGKIKGRSRKHHALRDEKTGRFVPATRRRKAMPDPEFIPAGDVASMSYPDSFIWKVRGKRTILQKLEGRRVKEAEIGIYDALANRIEDNVFPEAERLVMKNFMHELRFRVKSGMN